MASLDAYAAGLYASSHFYFIIFFMCEPGKDLNVNMRAITPFFNRMKI